MRTLTIIASLIFSLAVQVQPGPVFKIGTNGSIETNPSMIEPFYDVPAIKTLSYTLNSSISVSVGRRHYDVKTGYFEEWDDTERGECGFTVITVYSGRKKIFELRQPDMWTHTYEGQSMIDYRQYTNNRYFIPIALSKQVVALAFVGWPYGGEKPYLTIIALTASDAKLVFNKHMGINTITQSGKAYCMELQANIVEYGEDGKPFDDPNNVPIIHHLEVKDGLLYFK